MYKHVAAHYNPFWRYLKRVKIDPIESQPLQNEFKESGLLSGDTQKIEAPVNQVNAAHSNAAERLASAQSYIQDFTVAPEDNFLSKKESLDGQAIRRASAFVSLAKRSIEKSTDDGKIPA